MPIYTPGGELQRDAGQIAGQGGFNEKNRRESPPPIPDHELIHRIGVGSYGEVWLARNLLGAERAVKIVHRRSFSSDRPFEREFAGIQKFEPISRSHDSQVDILHVGRNGEYFYYVMELADDAEGQPSKASSAVEKEAAGTYVPRTLKLESCRRGRLPISECIDIGISLTTALAHLHNHGLVHRDVKPSNVIFVNGVPKLADIGLVTDFDATVSCVGTEGFLPPEGPGRPAADLYALGKVLYEISTGKDRQDYPEPPTWLGESSERQQLLELGEIVKKACAPEPARRYQSAEAMQADLLLLKTGKSVRQAHQLECRLKLMTRITAGVVALIVLGVVPYWLAIREGLRARVAEADSMEKLRGSYLAEAQALRYSGLAGRRFKALELLKKAAQIRPSTALRNEAIACLALSDMQLVKEFSGMPNNSAYVDFDCNGWRYGCRDEHGDIRIRSLKDNRELLRLPGLGAPPAAEFDFSQDGHLLVAFKGEPNGNVLRVWDVDQGTAILSLTNDFVRTPDFTRDGRRIVLYQRPNPIVIYDLGTGQQVGSYPVSSLPENFKFHPDGHELAVSFTDRNNVQLLDLATGKINQEFTGTAPIHNLAWHPNGRWLAASCRDGNNVLWDITTGKRTVLKAHNSASIGIGFSPNGNLLASAGWDARLQLQDVLSGHDICSLPVTRNLFAISPDSHWIACGSSYERVGLMEVALGSACTELYVEDQAGAGQKGCSFSPDGKWLASSHTDGFRLWDVATRRQIAFQPTDSEVFSVSFPGSRNTLITSAGDAVTEWPLSSIGNKQSPQPVIGRPHHLAPAPDSVWDYLGYAANTLALASNRTVQLVDLSNGLPIRQLHADIPFRFTALSPDGKWCAAGSWLTNAVEVFDTSSGNPVCALAACGSTGSLAFSPNGQWLAFCGANEYRFVRTDSWKMASAVEREDTGDLRGCVAFSPDSSVAAIAYSAQLIHLVEPATGHELATFEPHELSNIASLAFNPDGTKLAATTSSTAIELWDLRLIRHELGGMKLDWEGAPFAPLR